MLIISNELLNKIPESTKDSLIRYRDHRIRTGGFLEACLKNDFTGAVLKADPSNLRAIREIASYIWNYLPMGSWGSDKKVEEWIKSREELSNKEGT